MKSYVVIFILKRNIFLIAITHIFFLTHSPLIYVDLIEFPHTMGLITSSPSWMILVKTTLTHLLSTNINAFPDIQGFIEIVNT